MKEEHALRQKISFQNNWKKDNIADMDHGN